MPAFPHSRTLSLLFALLLLGLTATLAAANTSYVVQPGDTLAAISRRFHVSIDAIVQANNILNPNLIYAGQTLTIPNDGDNPPAPTPPPIGNATTYVVQPGDTLYRVALRFGVSLQALAQTNNISNVNFIYVGQVLVIPGAAASPPPPTNTPQVSPPGPTLTPPPAPGGANLLPNPSFEGGWYNRDGVPEFQVPDQWVLEWDEGDNPLDPDPWNRFVRPESRVLSPAFLPPSEHTLFIWDGSQTVKIFKQYGAISFRLLTTVSLPPATYEMQINVFPDLVSAYEGGQKVWAPDPRSGEVRLIVGGSGSGWLQPAFGQRNTFTYRFTLAQSQTITLGAAMRGRWAIANNGWFMDAWVLRVVR
ncbi:MAG: LysM peptidoglycan-binding domain-containing protein [Anaerolineales bacterium]|nr:LysM peptidoglycan-binding domain-containing protein [Anaerolineales bacterium]